MSRELWRRSRDKAQVEIVLDGSFGHYDVHGFEFWVERARPARANHQFGFETLNHKLGSECELNFSVTADGEVEPALRPLLQGGRKRGVLNWQGSKNQDRAHCGI